MIVRKLKKKDTLGRLFLFGEFALNTPSRTSGGEWDKGDTAPNREQASEKVAVVQDAGAKTPNRTTEKQCNEADRRAIERAEDEGMMVGRE